MRQSRRAGEHGQILVLFTLALVALLAMLGLLFDGGNALALRRQLQNAGDAGALAAANIVQSLTPRGCSATEGPPPGAPQSAIVTAARAGVRASLPWVQDSDISVTCPPGWSNYAVQVDVAADAKTLFGRVVGITGIRAGTTSQGLNGQISSSIYSIVVLDPSNPTWPNGRRGCPSVLISGGPTVTLEGSMVINSTCAASNGGALGTNGNSATITLTNDARIRIVGDFVPGPLTINPAPLVHQQPTKDPLAGLSAMPTLTTVSNSRLRLSGGSTVLNPGVYIGGIEMRNTAKAFLRPGIYVMQGGGLDIGAQNEVYSVTAGATSTTSATWATDCPAATCGVLIYNRAGTGSGAGAAMGQLSVGAGAAMKLRPYRPTADGSGANQVEYENLLFWQDANPVPTSSAAQPVVQLNGGGSVDLSGTIYAPSAHVLVGGGSGGTGGATDITLQFLVWDLTLQGNSTFTFRYRSELLAKPTDYGLIK
ncbi:MAG TPA: pilus assembly protein TadG-related protein [Candidatus Sulfomarinibacteraceae bacterium]|nr:pilus assembly protein TadG-related protein [Candidatus Sulfomarinibacteraceae bacterium]